MKSINKMIIRIANTSWNDRIFVMLNTLLLTFFTIITLYPMLFVVSASFSDPNAVASGEMILWPVNASLKAYKYILGYKEIWIGYANTIFYTFVGTLMNLVATVPYAYALSRRDLSGRKFFMTLFLIPMYFGGGMIPAYLNIRDLGLLDTRMVLLVSGLVVTYNLIIARTFFMGIPWELHEAAFMDGCSDFKLLCKVILPLSRPILVVLMLYYGVDHWNSYFQAMIYVRNRNKFPLQVFLKEILTQSQFNAAGTGDVFLSAEEMLEMARAAETANMLKYGIIVVSTVPMLILYPFLQKYFEKGAMIGSVKG